MITTEQARRLVDGRGHVLGTDGEKIGTIGQVFVDERTDEPEWVTANTGLFGMGESFVPLRGAEVVGDDVRVPYDKAKVKDAPRISDSDAHLSAADEDLLFSHYGLDDASDPRVDGPDRPRHDEGHDRYRDAGTGGVADRDRTDRDLPDRDHTDTSDDHRERADGASVGGASVGGDAAPQQSSSTRPAGEADSDRSSHRTRIRRYVVTEDVDVTVPVTHEEIRIEQEPIIEDGDAGDAPRDRRHDDGRDRG